MDLPVRVHPKSRLNTVELRDDDSVVVRVTAAPEDGKANEAVITLMADRLGVPKRSVAIRRGHTGRDKLLQVEGLTLEEALSRLRRD